MKPFKNLIEFIGVGNRFKHFYNKDIKCPVCGEIMWWNENNIDVTDHYTLHLVCKHECCTMEIKFDDYIMWEDKI